MSALKDDPVESGRSLRISKLIANSPERLFEMWTDPAHIQVWWGPEGVDCPYAEVDLRPGGSYRIANRLQDGTTLWIFGKFETVEPPVRLVYTWRTDRTVDSSERVTVQFTDQGEMTEVSILHELIADSETMLSHGNGWQGCLDKLVAYSALL